MLEDIRELTYLWMYLIPNDLYHYWMTILTYQGISFLLRHRHQLIKNTQLVYKEINDFDNVSGWLGSSACSCLLSTIQWRYYTYRLISTLYQTGKLEKKGPKSRSTSLSWDTSWPCAITIIVKVTPVQAYNASVIYRVFLKFEDIRVDGIIITTFIG